MAESWRRQLDALYTHCAAGYNDQYQRLLAGDPTADQHDIDNLGIGGELGALEECFAGFGRPGKLFVAVATGDVDY